MGRGGVRVVVVPSQCSPARPASATPSGFCCRRGRPRRWSRSEPTYALVALRASLLKSGTSDHQHDPDDPDNQHQHKDGRTATATPPLRRRFQLILPPATEAGKARTPATVPDVARVG